MKRLLRFSLSDLMQSLLMLALLAGILWGLYLLINLSLVLRNADDLSAYPMTDLFEMPVNMLEDAPVLIPQEGGRVSYRLYKLWGEFQYLTIPRLFAVWIFLHHFCMLGLFIWIVLLLLRFFNTLIEGSPFVLQNARRLRTVGLIVICGHVLDVLWKVGSLGILVNWLKAPLPFSDVISFISYTLALDLWQPQIVFAGLIILVIADIFRLGTTYREDTELTV